MSKKMKESSELSKIQQYNRVKGVAKSQPNCLNAAANVFLKKSLSKNGSPSIIRIVPNVLKQPKKAKSSAVQASVNQNSQNENLKSATSSTNIQLQDHTYLCKQGRTDNLDDNDLSLFEEVSDTDMAYTNFVQKSIQVEESIPSTSTEKKNDVPVVIENLNKTHSDQCCCSCRETLNIILRQQQEILNYLKSGKYFEVENKYDLLPTMPFDDINDFLDFDESLCNENVRSQFTSKIKKLLVSTEQKSVMNIMSSILTNELSKRISWIGIKETLAFGNTNVVGLIVDVVQDHHTLDVDFVKSRVADWLRRCGDRINNEMKKSERKAKQLSI